MKPLDDQLRKALMRREPPNTFAEKILASTRESESGTSRLKKLQKKFAWRWTAAVAAAVVVAAISLATYREHLRRINGERAKQEVLFALRLTSTQLRAVQERVDRVQQRTIELPSNRD